MPLLLHGKLVPLCCCRYHLLQGHHFSLPLCHDPVVIVILMLAAAVAIGNVAGWCRCHCAIAIAVAVTVAIAIAITIAIAIATTVAIAIAIPLPSHLQINLCQLIVVKMYYFSIAVASGVACLLSVEKISKLFLRSKITLIDITIHCHCIMTLLPSTPYWHPDACCCCCHDSCHCNVAGWCRCHCTIAIAIAIAITVAIVIAVAVTVAITVAIPLPSHLQLHIRQLIIVQIFYFSIAVTLSPPVWHVCSVEKNE